MVRQDRGELSNLAFRMQCSVQRPWIGPAICTGEAVDGGPPPAARGLCQSCRAQKGWLLVFRHPRPPPESKGNSASGGESLLEGDTRVGLGGLWSFFGILLPTTCLSAARRPPAQLLEFGIGRRGGGGGSSSSSSAQATVSFGLLEVKEIRCVDGR